MARTDWQYVSGSTNNNNAFFTGIRWKYRDDLFGQSDYPASRVESNTDIIEYQPYIGRKQSYSSYSYTSWKSSKYRYSYNTTSGSDPAAAANELGISTTFRFDKASNNTKYYPVTGSLSSGNVFNTSSTTLSRIIQVPHCSDGTSKLRLYFYVAGDSNTSFSWAETNQIVTLEGIPRYTTINSFTVSKRNETSFTFNWSTADTIDYAWYSTNNGSSWTGYDVADGTSGSFTVGGLSPNTTYQCKLRVRRKDSQLNTDSGMVTQTTYNVPSQSLKSKTETSITMNWSCDTTASYIQYSKDGGANWVNVGSVSATNGSYTISGLTAGSTYSIKTKVTRSASNTSYDTSASSQTTYNYPYITNVGSTNLTIGNSQTLTLYNPLGRSCTIYMKKDSTTGTQLYSGSCNTTTSTFTPSENTLYASIINAAYGNCVYYVVCSSPSATSGTVSGKYIVNETINKPELTSSSYLDTNPTTSALSAGIGHDTSSTIILNASTLQISLTATAKSSATISSISIEGSNRPLTQSGSSASCTHTINSPDKTTFSVVIIDSRQISLTTTITIPTENVKNYVPLTLIGTGNRNQPTNGKVNLGVSGKYFNASFGSQNNTLTVQYRFKENGSSTWIQDWTSNNLTVTPSGNTYSGSTSEPITGFDYTKAYNIEFKAVDKLNTVTSSVLIPKGQPVYWWNDNNFNIMKNLNVTGNSVVGGYIQPSSYVSKEGRISSADLDHQYPNDKVSMKLNISSSSMSTHKPSSDGFIQTFFWDNSGAYDTQFFLGNGDGYRPAVRTRGGSTSWAGAWRELAWRSDIPSNSSFTLAGLGEKSYNNLTDKPTIPDVSNFITKANLLTYIYPVGSIYMSVNNTSPQSFLGGTWVQLKDRFLLGTGDTYSNGATGGSATHTLTINEMPSHTHSCTTHIGWKAGNGADAGKVTTNNGNFNGWPTVIDNTGGGQAHNNMPPYLVVYMWKRTA